MDRRLKKTVAVRLNCGLYISYILAPHDGLARLLIWHLGGKWYNARQITQTMQARRVCGGLMMRIFLRIAFVVLALACLSRSHAADLFWNDDAGVFRFKDGHIDPTPLFETFDTRGIALDVAANRIWWSEILPIAGPGPAGVIRTGGTQGGAITDVVWQLHSPAGVAIDEGRRRIYWTDLGDGANPSGVYSANFDGSDARRIINAISISEIAGIAIDTAHDKLYFSYVNPLIDSLFAGSIARADLDGSNWEPIIGALTKPVGLAIDSRGKELFWADAGLNEGGGAIQAADLDGQDQRTLLGGLGMPQGVALDLAERQVYWADKATGKIQRTDMPGVLPFFEDVLTRLPAPTAIAIHNDPLAGPAWNVDMGGNWSLASNWDPRVPDATDDRAIFGDVIAAAAHGDRGQAGHRGPPRFCQRACLYDHRR